MKETYNYKGWLISDSFIKRTLAVFAYFTIGQLALIIVGIILVLTFDLIF